MMFYRKTHLQKPPKLVSFICVFMVIL